MDTDVATRPYNIITQLANYPLTDIDIKRFLAD